VKRWKMTDCYSNEASLLNNPLSRKEIPVAPLSLSIHRNSDPF
jgi:hypothetical protein